MALAQQPWFLVQPWHIVPSQLLVQPRFLQLNSNSRRGDLMCRVSGGEGDNVARRTISSFSVTHLQLSSRSQIQVEDVNLDLQNFTTPQIDTRKDYIRAKGTCAFPGWYADDTAPGEAHLYKIEKVIFYGKSDFQELLVFESERHGKVVILDGYIQLTEKDEFAYQEMLTHLALCSIPNPKKVLLVGGGDGGILREISRHSSIEHIDICEMDTMVIDVYKKFFPDIAVGYEDPRVHVHIAEGTSFVNSAPEGTYDAIIVDAFAPIGPVAEFYPGKRFLEAVTKALSPGGVMSSPADPLWRDDFVIADTIEYCKKIFKGSVNYAWTTTPSYSTGLMGFMLCSKEGPPVNFKIPINPLNPQQNGGSKRAY
ncbi:Spermidine/spermine synthase [Sesbania bispinosa]|nr:Spermidine/spermine synthase [Sesbania bispinosa]